MKKVKRISAIIIAVIFLSSFFAIPVHAVDPISATAIANGFAQAITAYGAANGVSLTFDSVESGNTSQIGEAIHDLWARFRADQQTTDDYLAIGEALMPSLFYKAEKAVGSAAIGISIAQQYMPDIDAFWNWMLSGPAEMVKVDNAYQWNIDPNTNEIEPKMVYSTGIMPSIPAISSSSNALQSFYGGIQYLTTTTGTTYSFSRLSSSVPVYLCVAGIGTAVSGFVLTTNYISCRDASKSENNSSYRDFSMSRWENTNVYVSTGRYNFSSSDIASINVPYYESQTAAVDAFINWLGDPTYDEVKVQPYVGDAVAKPVPIPDTTDPDYGPIPWTGDLDIPWNYTLFGDGTGVLTNEQTEDIIGTIDQAIVANPDKTIELEAEQDIPVNPSPSEIIIPFLPVEVPSFNFSLSGIWHYVREWVTSLGSWFALVFTVWGILPYALVVPVYATAVIVIVLGVYKRFFM